MSKQNSKKSQVWITECAKHLILLYENFPCLYDIKRPDYHNRNERQKALEEIFQEMKEMYPNMNLTYEQIKTKIHGIRSQYMAELNKIKRSQSTGVSPDEVYTPKLWCFEMLGFLSDSAAITSRGESNLNLETVVKESQDSSQDYVEEEDLQQEEEYEEELEHSEDEQESEMIFDGYITDTSVPFSPSSSRPASTSRSSAAVSRSSSQPSCSKGTVKAECHTVKQKTQDMKKRRRIEEDDELRNLIKITGQVIQNQTEASVDAQKANEYLFCQYLASEMSKIKDEDILDELKQHISAQLFQAKKKYKASLHV